MEKGAQQEGPPERAHVAPLCAAPPPTHAAARLARGRAPHAEPGEWSGLASPSPPLLCGVVLNFRASRRECGWSKVGVGGGPQGSGRELRYGRATAKGLCWFRDGGRTPTRSTIPGTGIVDTLSVVPPRIADGLGTKSDHVLGRWS